MIHMQVSTQLSISDYKKFKAKAEELDVSEYELAKQCILAVINQPTEVIKAKGILNKIMEAVAKELDKPPYNLTQQHQG